MHLLVCWFVSTMTQKLLSEFPLSLDGGRVSVQSRTSLTLSVDLDKETDPGFFIFQHPGFQLCAVLYGCPTFIFYITSVLFVFCHVRLQFLLLFDPFFPPFYFSSVILLLICYHFCELILCIHSVIMFLLCSFFIFALSTSFRTRASPQRFFKIEIKVEIMLTFLTSLTLFLGHFRLFFREWRADLDEKNLTS